MTHPGDKNINWLLVRRNLQNKEIAAQSFVTKNALLSCLTNELMASPDARYERTTHEFVHVIALNIQTGATVIYTHKMVMTMGRYALELTEVKEEQ